MSLPDQIPRKDYVGNGVKTNFIYDFLVDSASEMVPYIDNVPQVSGFTVNGVGVEAGGSVDFAVAPGDTLDVSLKRLTEEDQQNIYTEYGPFFVKSVEAAFDKLTKLSQEQREQLTRAIASAVSGVSFDRTFPEPDAGKAVKWNAAGDGLENSDFDPDETGDAAAIAVAAAASASDDADATAADRVQTGLDVVDADQSAQDAASSAAGVNLPPIIAGDAGKILEVNPGETGYQLIDQPLEGSLAGIGFSGLKISNNGDDLDHDIDIAVGRVPDSTGSLFLPLTSPITAAIDQAWAAVTVAGLFASAVITDTAHVMLIRRDSDGLIFAGVDDNRAGTNIPAGWSNHKILASLPVDTGSLLAFNQSDDYFELGFSTDMSLPENTGGGTIVMNGAPVGVPNITLNIGFTMRRGTADYRAWFRSGDAINNAVPANTNQDLAVIAASTEESIIKIIPANELGEILYRTLANNGGTIRGRLQGWFDKRRD